MRLPTIRLDKLTKKFEQFFESEELEKCARQTGFVKRCSKITGTNFLILVVFGQHLKEKTLDAYGSFIKKISGIRLRRQSLDERFNAAASAYVKAQLEKLLGSQNTQDEKLEGLVCFNRVRIADCTSFQLPASYQQEYKGAGGDGSKAAIKIFFEYDFKTGQVLHLEQESGTRSDTKFNNCTLEDVQPNDLIIRDLGFNSLKFMEQLALKEAYYLTRYKLRTLIFYKNKKTRIGQLISKMNNQQNLAEYEVELGGDEKVRKALGKVRLVIQRLPRRAVKQKMKKLKDDARRKSFTPTKEQKLLCHFNVYITNAQADKLPIESIRGLYGIRWQIELTFKIWKSIFSIDKVKEVKIERFRCFFLAA